MQSGKINLLMAKHTALRELSTFTTFGELLCHLRMRASLTQRELAQRVGYHYSYISRLEKNERKPDLSILQLLFVRALKIENDPEIVARLLELAAGGNESAGIFVSETGPAKSLSLSAGFPVSLTPLLGREIESSALIKILLADKIRLVTLVGPPGVGKTRLALHVAEQVFPNFKDGAVFVNLMPVLDADQVISALAAVLGVQENARESIFENVKSALRSKNLLILMDNFEQVLEAAPQLLPLLGEAPQVKIIATSREALRLNGEQEFPLAPLAVPDEKTDQTLLDFPSVQLFLQRARSVKPDFELDEKTASHAAEICRRLDGLPLAIELAAARVHTLSLPAMLEQFDRRFKWLTRGGRELPSWRQNLWDAVEWSYALLGSQERTLLNRLSVFNTGWRLEAAEAVCSDEMFCAPSEILDLLMQLADKSLITADIKTERYHFLETLREFAHEKLKAGGELERMRQRHAEYYMKFMETARPHLSQGSDQTYWLDRVEEEHNNLRAVLAWIIETPARATAATEFVLMMSNFWLRRSYFTEARNSLNQILALVTEPSTMRADLLRHASDFFRIQGDYDHAYACDEESYTISKALDYKNGLYASLDGLAILAGIKQNYARAAELLEQVIAYRRETNDSTRLPPTLNNLAIAARRLGNLERARELYAEAISITRVNGNLMSLAHSLNGLSEIHVELKEYAGAIRLQCEGLSIRQQLGDLKGMAFSLGSIAISLFYLDNPLLAAQLESVSRVIYQKLGITSSSAAQTEHENLMAELRARLGDAAFEQAWSGGQAMPLEQAVALAAGQISQ